MRNHGCTISHEFVVDGNSILIIRNNFHSAVNGTQWEAQVHMRGKQEGVDGEMGGSNARDWSECGDCARMVRGVAIAIGGTAVPNQNAAWYGRKHT